MRIESKSGKGDFKLISNEEVICTLTYDNWFSSRATTELLGHNIEIKPINIWFSRFIIYKDKNEVGKITFNWKGDIIITFADNNSIKNTYLIKAKGLWKLRFEVFNEEEKLIFVMASKGKWNKFNYDYEIKFSNYEKPKSLNELLIFCGYGTNLYVKMIAVG